MNMAQSNRKQQSPLPAYLGLLKKKNVKRSIVLGARGIVCVVVLRQVFLFSRRVTVQPFAKTIASLRTLSPPVIY